MHANCIDLNRAASYADCERLFNDTRPRGKEWGDDERPLGSSRQHHYRVRRGIGYFDVLLYSTTMARFYKPETDGSYRVMYTSDSRLTSSQFMRYVVHSSKTMQLTTTDGSQVTVPIAGSGLEDTDLWFDKAGRLDTTRSTHRQVYHKVASDAAKAFKKKLRTDLATLFSLLELRVPERVAEFVPPSEWERVGRPFTGKPHDVTSAVRMLMYPDFNTAHPTEADIKNISDVFNGCLDFILDQREYKSTSRHSWKPAKELAPLQAKSVTTSTINSLMELLPHHQQFAYKPIPMWSATLPTSWTFYAG